MIFKHDAQYDYYGKRIATCSSDGYIKVFDVSKPENSTKQASFKAYLKILETIS